MTLDYPNSEKLNQNIHGFRAIQQFLEYLDSEGIRLVQRNKDVPYIELNELCEDEKLNLIYKFYEVDPVRLEDERRMMLEACI
ncbi:MAG: hypothetical protein J6Y02_04520 [Pseudobutyrivibrio sp.]|nr:hypothetical protein [Pseudobutyrivibrio sp.]